MPEPVAVHVIPSQMHRGLWIVLCSHHGALMAMSDSGIAAYQAMGHGAVHHGARPSSLST